MGCPDTSAHLPVQAGVKALPPSGYATTLSAKTWLASGNASSVRVKLADVDIYATHDGHTTKVRSRRDLSRLSGSNPAFVQVVPRGATPPTPPVLVPFGEAVHFDDAVRESTGVESIAYVDTDRGLVPYLQLAHPTDARPIAVCLVSDTASVRRGVGQRQPRPVIAHAASREVAAVVWNDLARRLIEEQRTAELTRRFNRLQHTINGAQHLKNLGMYAASGVFTAGTANVVVKSIDVLGKATEASYAVEDVVTGEPLNAADNVSSLTIDAAVAAFGVVGSAAGVGWSTYQAGMSFMNALRWDAPPVTTGDTVTALLQRSLNRARRDAADDTPFEHAMEHVAGWSAVDTRNLSITDETPACIWLNPPLLDDAAVMAEADSVISRHIDSSRGLSEHEASILRKRHLNEWQEGTAATRTILRTPGHVLNAVAQTRAYHLWDADAFHQRKTRTSAPARRSRRGGRSYQSFPKSV